ncbi:MAG TPA: metallophosphoesterase [Candidatus Binataceae bacterium]|nr:metallophosphoesterase [Candidatus Binataceae bacterium]
MSTASLTAELSPRKAATVRRRRKPPLPLRPLHRLWRRTIDEIEVRKVALPVRRLPAALEGMAACQISDFHVDRDEDLVRLGHAVELINHQEPAFVFLTGDYFSGRDTMRRYLGAFGRELRRLNPAVGTFAIAGNHDHWASFDDIARTLKSAGIEVLSNESRRVVLRAATFTVVGIDDLWTRRADPARAFRNVRPDDCTLVLAHNPDTALYTRHLEPGPGVMLSGHTHGGVVRLPYYGSPLKSILKLGKQFYSGLNRYRDFYIYTNRGLGTFWLRLRINCRPEVSSFHLTSHFPRIQHETDRRRTRRSKLKSRR